MEEKSLEEIEKFKKSPLYGYLINVCAGSYWSANGMARVYFNSAFYKKVLGIDWVTDEKANLVGVSFLGDTLPLREGTKLLKDLETVRMFFDLHTEKVYLAPWNVPSGFAKEFEDLALSMQEYIDKHFEKGGKAREG